jgi:hypothetical protein
VGESEAMQDRTLRVPRERVASEKEPARRSIRQDLSEGLADLDERFSLLEFKLESLVLLTSLISSNRLYVKTGNGFHKVTCPTAQVALRSQSESPPSDGLIASDTSECACR